MPSPVFDSKSSDAPSILHISFQKDPKAGLGAQLVNADKGGQDEMFIPGYAVVGRLLDGDTVARAAGVQVGDIIIAINGTGFRRFAVENEPANNISQDDTVLVELDNAVVKSNGDGTGYNALLAEIKEIKKKNGSPPLIISLERYGFDARCNSWHRFLTARDNNVPDAMKLIQEHEAWRKSFFPIDLSTPGLQHIMRQKAVSEIDLDFLKNTQFPPTVYVNYGMLQTLQQEGKITPEDVVQAFVIFTERMLSKSSDPRNPKTCQFIDMSGVSITGGLRVETLKKIYQVFEPNYPETLYKMVLYPVSTMVAMTATKLLSFVNEKTKKKFLITNSLEKVCAELGWNQADVERCGGVTEFMHEHEKAGTSMIM